MFATLLIAPTITVASLLAEQGDLETLTRGVKYNAAQASSYERSKDPFANGDAGHFLRQEGLEDVMADLKGSGAVVRIWSANPSGTIRFYFDGEAKPRIEAPMADLLGGRWAIKPPLAYVVSQGYNVYLPMPYARSLKITAEGAGGLYYHVGYRTYPAGTAMRTLTADELEASPARFVDRRQGQTRWSYDLDQTVAPGATVDRSFSLKGGGQVTGLVVTVPSATLPLRPGRLWNDPRNAHQILRHLILEGEFDGETTIRVPLGDLFGAPVGPRPFQTRAIAVLAPKDGLFGGSMTFGFPMPFRAKGAFRIRNVGRLPVRVQATAVVDRRPWTSDSLLFHAQWRSWTVPTRPFRDLRLLDAKGEGLYVGTLLHIANPDPRWWGEGDEKVYVDGERFPSTFGTGTEDYFGYAWSSPQLFQAAYHAQTRCDGPFTGGHSAMLRLHIPDPIPFKKSLVFDIEAWHHAPNVTATWATTSLWYARPGGSPPTAIDLSRLPPPESKATIPTVKGVLEGEKLAFGKTGGEVIKQEGFLSPSAGVQLWWRVPNLGDRLTVRFKAPVAGRYKVYANLCHAVDYGVHRLTVNGADAGTLDLFQARGVDWRETHLGTFDLPAGESSLVVESVGANEKAIPNRCFGLDYLRLERTAG